MAKIKKPKSPVKKIPKRPSSAAKRAATTKEILDRQSTDSNN